MLMLNYPTVSVMMYIVIALLTDTLHEDVTGPMSIYQSEARGGTCLGHGGPASYVTTTMTSPWTGL